MMANAREETLGVPNSVVGVAKYMECKLADLHNLLQVQVDDLKQHIGELREASATKDELRIQIQSMDRSVSVAAQLMDKRLESMNEFRNSLRDQAGTFIARPEFAASREKVDDTLRALSDFRIEMKAKASSTAVTWAVVFAVASLAASVLGMLVGVTARS